MATLSSLNVGPVTQGARHGFWTDGAATRLYRAMKVDTVVAAVGPVATVVEAESVGMIEGAASMMTVRVDVAVSGDASSRMNLQPARVCYAMLDR